MKKYDDNIRYWIYQNMRTDDYYAIEISAAKILDTYHSDMDDFLYAPDDLLVECIPVTFNRNSGMIDFNYENKIQVKVMSLKKRAIAVSN
jgi:hypothetical protein